jgi:hypothetical protein
LSLLVRIICKKNPAERSIEETLLGFSIEILEFIIVMILSLLGGWGWGICSISGDMEPEKVTLDI